MPNDLEKNRLSPSLLWPLAVAIIAGSILLFLEYRTRIFRSSPTETPILIPASIEALLSSEVSATEGPEGVPVSANGQDRTATATVPTAPAPTNTRYPTLTPVKISYAGLPQTWQGTFDQPGFGSYPMILRIEEVDGASFSGYIHWPTLRNSITAMRGRFVQDFGDFIEQTKWRFVEGYGKANGGDWIAFTETELIQGSRIVLNGWYYAHSGEDGVMRGAWFRDTERSQPSGDFVITFEAAP